MKRNDPAVRRLVNAVLVPGFLGTSAPEWLVRELDAGLGGVCWFAHNLSEGGGTRALADEIHAAREGALIWCDEEGGAVSRLDAATGSPWPGHAALGQVDDVDATRAVARGIGETARRAGVDIALSPVVDVNSDAANPVIGVRSFGDTPGLVARHGAAFVDGLQSTGVAACAKHFPGHGATRVDSHLGLPTVDASRDVLWARELAPFLAAAEAGVRCVMTAHVSFPAVDVEPATMSPVWMRLLREEIGFDGVVGTDALDMRAISAGVGRGEGAVRSLVAGVDAVCIGNPAYPESYEDEDVFETVRSAIFDAIDEERLDVGRVEEAAGRLAELSAWRRDRHTEPVPDASCDGVEIARRAVQSDGDVTLDAAPLVLVHTQASIAAGDVRFPLARYLSNGSGEAAYAEVTSVAETQRELKRHADLPVVVVTDGRSGTSVVDTVRDEQATAVVVHTGPTGTSAELSAPIIHTWGGGAASAQAAAELIRGGHR